VNQKSDIVIVGGGIIGCAVAYELSKRGISVSVVDGRDVGGGATRASAGMLAPFIEGQHLEIMWTLGSRSLELYDSFVADVVSDSGHFVPYERTGTLEIALDKASLECLERAAERLSSVGVKCSLLTRAEAIAAEPHLGSNVHGGLVVSTHGFVNANALTCSLRHAAAKHGVCFITASEVIEISSHEDSVMVKTAGGTLLSGAAVLAAGSWVGRIPIEGVSPLPIRPVRGQLLRLLWTEASLARIVWGAGCYVVPWSDGSILVGATVEDAGFDECATVSGVMSLLGAVCDLLPAAQGAGFDTVRVGLRPATPDDLPVVGRSAAMPNLVYATGHYRNGVLLAPLTARLVANLMLDGQEDPVLGAIGPSRFGEF